MEKHRLDYHRNTALRALENYSFNVKKIDFLTEATNVFFKVKDHLGKSYALKIFQEESSSIEDNLAEAWFIDQVKTRSSLCLPNILSSSSGEKIVKVPMSISDVNRYCETPFERSYKRVALYEWVDGTDYDGHETPELIEQAGMLTAELHRAARDLNLPAAINPKKWDRVFYYRDEKPVYRNSKYIKRVSKEFVRLMDQAVPLLDNRLGSLYSESGRAHLIHADLNPWNIMLTNEGKGSRLCVIDFEEAMLGLPIHDFAVHLYYYEYHENLDFEMVKNHYFKGYKRVLPLPDFDEKQLFMLMTARRVNFMNYALIMEDDPSEYIEMCIPRLKKWLDLAV